MGYVNGSIIFWKGDYGAGDNKIKAMRTPILAGNQPTVDRVNTLKNTFKLYTDALASAVERLHKLEFAVDEPGANANLDIKARIAFKDSADGKIYRVELPAPKNSIFIQEGEGDRVTDVVLNAIVDALSTAYDRTFIPLWGKKIQRS